jgi:L-2-hydroxyglutarate oxidase LhgO
MGGEIYFGQKVQGIVSNGNSAVVQTLNTEFEAGRIVNCAGLGSIENDRQRTGCTNFAFRGEYFNLKKRKNNIS